MDTSSIGIYRNTFARGLHTIPFIIVIHTKEDTWNIIMDILPRSGIAAVAVIATLNC